MNLANAIFWLIFFITMVLSIAIANLVYNETASIAIVIGGLILGILLGYLSSILLYAFGSSVENTQKIAELLYSQSGKELDEDATEQRFMYYCKNCDSMYSDIVEDMSKECPDCKKKLLSTGVLKKDWISMDSKQKQSMKKSWKSK